MADQDRAARPVPGFLDRSISRRHLMKGMVGLMAAGAVAPLAAACAPQQTPPAPQAPAQQPAAGQQPGAAAQPAQPAQGEPKRGGSLKVAILGEPPALDPVFTTATVTANTTWHIFESLFHRNSKQEAVPHLIEKYEPSGDGKNLTISLRKGVPFHNDREMTSADVVASLKRWGSMAARGKLIFDRLESIDAKDKYIVAMAFKEPTTGILPVFVLCSRLEARMPRQPRWLSSSQKPGQRTRGRRHVEFFC